MEQVNDKWRMLTKELIIRLTESILDSRFPHMNEDSSGLIQLPPNYSFDQRFTGKFGINKDLEGFPNFKKLGEKNALTLSFFLKPTFHNKALNRRNLIQSVMPDSLPDDLKIVENWKIFLELFEHAQNVDFTENTPHLIE